TREKGKYYMHLLLTVEPTARILDMYASDMIYMIFKNIQEEFEATRVGGDPRPVRTSDSLPVGKTPRPDPEAKSSSGHALVWVGASTAVAAAGAVAYFMLNGQPSTKHVDANFKP